MKRIAMTAMMFFTLIGAAATPHAPIAIIINGVTLPLQPPPRFEKNVLFVPVRRTIEALGLEFDRSGDRIATEVGAKTVTLTMGSRVARVDGDRLMLDAAPVEIGGVLYAPLRFFTDVLGAQARFDRRSNAVTIIAQLVGRSGAGFLSTGSGFQRFGTVAGVDVVSDPPTITLGYNGGVKVIAIAPNAIVDMEDVNVNVTMPGELGNVRPGDFARVEMRKDGRVERVVDEYGSRSGRIVAIGGGDFVLGDGQVIAAGRATDVSLNGQAAAFTQLRPGDAVTVRYNVESGEVREVLASRAGMQAATSNGGVAITSVVTDATHPLRANESVRVSVEGTPNGSATFDVGSDVENHIMQQSSPGVYVGTYRIPIGTNFDDAALVAHLTIGNVTVDATAPQTISASSVPPGIADFAPDAGSTVNTDRPAIYASFAADAVAVNAASASMSVNGRDVTAACMRTAQFIQYMPDYSFPNGPVRVTVRIADESGNTSTKTWTFNVRAR